MPYITDEQRARFEPAFAAMPPADDAGELNYILTRVALRYVKAKGATRYQHLNDVFGAFDGAAREFYRRFAAPYEDIKARENGEVAP